jgi:hypothetical protein
MSTPNPIEVAAAPALIAVIQAVQQFIADMGSDPAKWMLNFPGAQLKMMGAIQLQLPQLATAEGALAQSTVNGVLAGWITKLQALQKPAA